MKISKERAEDLGLITRKEDCQACDACSELNGRLYCGSAEEFIDEMGDERIDCPEIDEERLREEMTEEEYDAYRHNRLEIEED